MTRRFLTPIGVPALSAAPSSTVTGAMYYDTDDGKLYVYNGSTWSLAGAQGVQGTTGDAGATGAQGVQGFIGAQGTTGLQGFTGNNGAQGTQGLQGTSGGSGGDNPYDISLLFMGG